MFCICGHEREWHDSCSKCYCPFFIDQAAASDPAVLKAWKRGERDRKRREK